ncbi:MAG: NAD(P)H-dependent oxidoreductase [Betaproteobacteria bacterium]
MTLLQLNASIFAEGGQSSLLAQDFVDRQRRANPGLSVIVRDLATEAVPHLSAQRFQAFLAKPEARTPEQQEVVAYSDALVDEVRRADVIVLGLPMYNFGVPSTLKAYFDHIARAGATFRYTDKGPVGLLMGKKVYVFATRGGMYKGTAADSETAYVRHFLAFLGMDDVEFVYAEGLAMGDAAKLASLAQARLEAERMLEPELLAA